ncbi:hypothetical protein [Streptomyces sp. NPDC057696]
MVWVLWAALSGLHEQHGDEAVVGAGNRVEYVIVELRGAIGLSSGRR